MGVVVGKLLTANERGGRSGPPRSLPSCGYYGVVAVTVIETPLHADWSVPVLVIVNVPEPIVVDGFVPEFAGTLTGFPVSADAAFAFATCPEPHGEIRDEQCPHHDRD
jgi:hypothetical protein